MRRVLLIVESSPDNGEHVQCASDLVEFATYSIEGTPKWWVEIGVVAEAADCLEIALPVLGRGEPRVIEGGKRERTPVRLFPFLAYSFKDEVEGRVLALDTLRDRGAVEMDAGVDNLPDYKTAVARALEQRWDFLVPLGDETSQLPHSVQIQGDAQIIRPASRDELRKYAYEFMTTREKHETQPFFGAEFAAVTQAFAFERILDALDWSRSER